MLSARVTPTLLRDGGYCGIDTIKNRTKVIEVPKISRFKTEVRNLD